jgi:hypothetical protein
MKRMRPMGRLQVRLQGKLTASPTDFPYKFYKFSFTTPSCCSVAQGALVGTSVAASLG